MDTTARHDAERTVVFDVGERAGPVRGPACSVDRSTRHRDLAGRLDDEFLRRDPRTRSV